jgi:glucokinase
MARRLSSASPVYRAALVSNKFSAPAISNRSLSLSLSRRHTRSGTLVHAVALAGPGAGLEVGLIVPVDRVRMAWLRAMEAHVRAASTHETAAALHTHLGQRERAARESEKAAGERRS